MTLTNETLAGDTVASDARSRDLVVLESREGASPRIDVSVVVPLMNEEATVVTLFDRIRRVCTGEKLAFEVIFVDDGSTDGSLDVLHGLSARDPRAQIIRQRRNFGKAAALAAGFRASRGAAVITMDADLQDDPEEIPGMLALLDDGFDVVSGWKKERHDPLSRRLASKFFNAVTRRMSGLDLHDFNCGLKAYSGLAAHDIADTSYGELHRYLPVIANSHGFKVTEKVVRHHPRTSGRSRYGLERYIRGMLDLITVAYLTKYGRRPMHAFGGVALWLALPGLALLGYALIGGALLGLPTAGATLAVAGAVMVVAAVQCGLLGLLAEVMAQPRASYVPSMALGRREVLFSTAGSLPSHGTWADQETT